MAETLSLAKTVVDGVLGKMAATAADEVAKMLGVRQDVRYIEDELEMMQSFLRVAETQNDNDNEMLRTWIKQVKDLAYQIEDCLELFFLHIKNRTIYHRLWTLRTRHKIASDIRVVRAMVEEVSHRNIRYCLIKPPKLENYHSEYGNCYGLIKPPNFNYDGIPEYGNFATQSMYEFLVEEIKYGNHATRTSNTILLRGQLLKKAELIKQIADGSGCRKVIAITGSGGVGKTTLAKNVYDNKEVIRGFTTRLWVTVSQRFDPRNLLMKILKQIPGDEKERMKTIEELGIFQCVREELENKAYFVVLDDMWSIQAWNYVENAFPDNNKGSRIVVTTRNTYGIDEACNFNCEIFPLHPLSPRDSCDLLLRKLNNSDIVDKFLYQHKNLMRVIDRIVGKCMGLPLSLVTIGGLLARKGNNTVVWEKLIDELPSEQETDTFIVIKKILDLSYSDLPYLLKPCLLYLSIFPEDYEFERRTLVYRWIAEGFVRERRDMTLEEVAKEYFKELLFRNLIQPLWILDENCRWIKRYRVHDILRELLVAKSIDENIFFFTSEQGNMASKGYVRHLVVTDSTKFQGNESSIRSVSIFNGPIPDLLLSSPSKPSLLKSLYLDTYLKESKQVVRRLQQFGNLKYISVPFCVSGLAKSIENLQNLQTLEVHYYDTREKFNISKLRKLRHFRIGTGAILGQGIRNLKELRTISYIDIGESHPKVVEELGELHQLTTLEVRNLRKAQFKSFSASLCDLRCLRHLTLGIDESLDEAADCFLDSVYLPPVHLDSIRLNGWIKNLPTWFSLVNLKKIELYGTKLGDDAMAVLQRVHSLSFLLLCQDAYVGAKLIFANNTFPKLRILNVWYMTNLVQVVFQDHSLPELTILSISDCNLENGINGVEFLPRINKVKLRNIPVPTLAALEQVVHLHPNQVQLVCE